MVSYRAIFVVSVLTLFLLPPHFLFAQDQDSPPAPAASFKPEDKNKFDGDHLRFKVNIPKFKGVDSGQEKCAPRGSKASVTWDNGEFIFLRFKDVPEKSAATSPTPTALPECPPENWVDDATQYKIEKSTLLMYDVRRTGFTFGGLVVPFKFYLGGDRKIIPSSTLAPYIGFRNPFGWEGFGITSTPLISAGLGMVPVANSETGKTETKTALSAAVGLVLTSTKSDSFNAGVVFGKDFLSHDDRARDPTVDTIWFSVYVGYAM